LLLLTYIDFVTIKNKNNMIIKPAIYKKVMVEQKRLVEEEVYGCDFCQKEFTRPDNIDATLHYRKSNKEAENLNKPQRPAAMFGCGIRSNAVSI
jgi:hypothetical protein